MPRWNRLFCFSSLIFLVSGSALPQAAEPTLRTSTRLVQFSVVVRDKSGPRTHLSASDFVVLDRGKPQKVTVFQHQPLSGEHVVEKPLPPNSFSNRWRTSLGEGVTVVLLDSLNTLVAASDPYTSSATNENGALAYAKQQALRFARDLDPHERVAVYSLGRSLRVLCDFTGSREDLLRSIGEYRDASFTSQNDAEPEPFHSPVPGTEFHASVDRSRRAVAATANNNRAGATFTALRVIAAHLADIPGRKNLVWLTSDLPFSGAAAAQVLNDPNISIYPVDARGLTASYDPYYQPKGLATLRDIADRTGGRAYLNTNDLSGAIRAAADDGKFAYTLGFYPEESTLDGAFHELTVRVGPANVDVRYPHSYFASKETHAAHRTGYLRALNSPLDAAGIGLEARVERVGRQAGPVSLNLWCSIDIRALQWEQTGDLRTSGVEVYTVQQDIHGGVLEKNRRRIDLRATRDQYLAYLQSGVVFGERIETKLGFTQLRVIVGDPETSATGTLIIPASQIQ